MSPTFDPRRFLRLVRHDLQLLHPRYSTQGASMLSAVLFPVMMVIVMTLLGDDPELYSSPLYRLLLCLGFPLFHSVTIPYSTISLQQEKGKKNRGIYFALLPASKCEKYWSIFIVSLVVVPAVLVFGSLLLDTLLALFRIGPWQQFAWQVGPLNHPVPYWMPLLVLVLPLVAVATAIWTATFRSKALAFFGWMMALLLWLGASVGTMFALWGRPAVPQWIPPAILALQLALFALVVFLGRRRLDRMAY